MFDWCNTQGYWVYTRPTCRWWWWWWWWCMWRWCMQDRCTWPGHCWRWRCRCCRSINVASTSSSCSLTCRSSPAAGGHRLSTLSSDTSLLTRTASRRSHAINLPRYAARLTVHLHQRLLLLLRHGRILRYKYCKSARKRGKETSLTNVDEALPEERRGSSTI